MNKPTPMDVCFGCFQMTFQDELYYKDDLGYCPKCIDPELFDFDFGQFLYRTGPLGKTREMMDDGNISNADCKLIGSKAPKRKRFGDL